MATVQQLVSGATKPTAQIVTARALTTSATPVVAQLVRQVPNCSVVYTITVIGVRTDAGGPGATANFTRLFRAKRVGNTTTLTAIDTIGTDRIDEVGAAIAIAVAANNIDVQLSVTGLAAENYTWDATTRAIISATFA